MRTSYRGKAAGARSSALARCLALAILGATAGCDPVAGVKLRQPLAPSPDIECVRTALAASPLVTNVGPAEYYKALPGYMFQIVLVDSAAPAHVMPPDVTLLVPSRDTASLEVFVGYFHAMTSSITPQRARDLAAAGTIVTRLVHDACAPRSPAEARCRIEGMGRSKPCA